MIKKFKGIGGETKELLYDKKIKKLNLELGVDKIGIPLIQIQDWTKERSRALVTLHIKEAMELKSIIDKLVFDYLLDKEEAKP